jgi:hypothetical protein
MASIIAFFVIGFLLLMLVDEKAGIALARREGETPGARAGVPGA